MKPVTLIACVVAIAMLGACDREVTTVQQEVEPATCFNCHSDDNTALVAAELQWERSVHASAENTNRSTTPCNGCHTSEGFKQRIESGTTPDLVNNPTVIHCFTCHAPHTNGDFSLRVEAAQALQNGFTFDLGSANLCVVCHQARRNVNTYVVTEGGTVTLSGSWGPHHSVQGDMVMGSNGYEYDDYTYDRTEHRSATEDGCLDCHFKFTRNSRVGGHAFNMRWTDEDGEILNTAACVPCHGATSNFNIDGVQTEFDTITATLKGLLVGRGWLTAGDSPVGGQVLTTDEAGAVWNYLMAIEDRSRGVHNRKYIRGLVESSIEYLNGSLPANSPETAASAPWVNGGSK